MSGEVKEEPNSEENTSEDFYEEVDIKYDLKAILHKEENIDGN